MKANHLFFIAFLVVGCGTNIYEQFDDQDPGEVATVALDEGNSDKAIEVLTAALNDDPANPELISLLASAKAQKAGVDTMDFALISLLWGKHGYRRLIRCGSRLQCCKLSSDGRSGNSSKQHSSRISDSCRPV